ncbi:aromatic acid exporter family protein [Alkalihalophilus marmarensis]|uniref:aromatic acid exporter family protein n=1 Tax=Alkalihalophilus marmarensis TaxID=521377 RepID=UPI002E1E7961|nr:aromatic acid exporter family protein [Alkalihalophilus marmarensis]
MKKITIPSKFIGGRIIKTGVAVFITALICQFLNLPVAFAIVTAIVTIEPTAADSIRKGLQRFPASLIGTAISLTIIYFFGQSPLSYTLAAVLTITACVKLKLEAGTLVATLAAVAIVPTVEGNYLLTFLERAGTTTIALFISTVVNVSIFPPKFFRMIEIRNRMLFKDTADLLSQKGKDLLGPDFDRKKSKKQYEQVAKEIERSLQLCQYQLEEWKFHRHSIEEMRRFHLEQKKLQLLQQVLYHLNGLFVTKLHTHYLEEKQKDLLSFTFLSLSCALKDPSQPISNEHFERIKQLDNEFWHLRSKTDADAETVKKYHHHFSPETVVLFSLLSIHDILEELEHLYRYYERFKPTTSKKEID